MISLGARRIDTVIEYLPDLFLRLRACKARAQHDPAHHLGPALVHRITECTLLLTRSYSAFVTRLVHEADLVRGSNIVTGRFKSHSNHRLIIIQKKLGFGTVRMAKTPNALEERGPKDERTADHACCRTQSRERWIDSR
jgi:hypothetical protein